MTILSTLPSAGVGAILALLFTGTELSLIAVIGIILLIGIVKKNGIMMVDFALEVERNEGRSPSEAIYQACLLRFRPIMMTTMAALLGSLPLALGKGVGSELRRPLGIAIVGGLIFSQMLTLYTTPVIYLYLDRFRLWFSGYAEKTRRTIWEESWPRSRCLFVSRRYASPGCCGGGTLPFAAAAVGPFGRLHGGTRLCETENRSPWKLQGETRDGRSPNRKDHITRGRMVGDLLAIRC